MANTEAKQPVNYTEATKKSIKEIILVKLNEKDAKGLRKHMLHESSVTDQEVAERYGITPENANRMRLLGLDCLIKAKTFRDRATWVELYECLQIDPNHKDLVKGAVARPGMKYYLREIIQVAVLPEYKENMMRVVDSDIPANRLDFMVQLYNAVFDLDKLNLPDKQQGENPLKADAKFAEVKEKLQLMTNANSATEIRVVLKSYLNEDEDGYQEQVDQIDTLNFRSKADLIAAIEWLEDRQKAQQAVTA